MDKLWIRMVFCPNFPITKENLEIPAAYLPEHKPFRHALLLTAAGDRRVSALQFRQILEPRAAKLQARGELSPDGLPARTKIAFQLDLV